MRSPETASLIPLSKRAHVFYLEHAKVVQKDERVLYLTQHGAETEHFFNVPHHNTALLLLGQGTSITDSAARMLAESGVTIAFVGTGGSPLHCGAEPVLLSPQSEYRATEYMQAWVQMWLDESRRVAAAKRFVVERARWVEEAWSADPELGKRGIVLGDRELDEFEAAVKAAASTESLMCHEAVWAKRLYAKLTQGFGLKEFNREEGLRQQETPAQRANSLLDHGNYVAYGYGAVALFALGISFAFPVLHGKTRRGALVFDVADLFKDALVMPLAFSSAATGAGEFRKRLIERCQAAGVLDRCIETVKKVC